MRGCVLHVRECDYYKALLARKYKRRVQRDYERQKKNKTVHTDGEKTSGRQKKMKSRQINNQEDNKQTSVQEDKLLHVLKDKPRERETDGCKV